MRDALKLAIIIAVIIWAPGCHAQEVVHVGRGSYAAFPPPGVAQGQPEAFEKKELFLLKEDGRPIPSNKWWTQLVVSRFARSLWVYPLKVDTSEQGLDLFFPIKWAASGNDPATDFPLRVSGRDFKPVAARAKDWSDWAVSFRLDESPDKFVDVTLGEGMPYVWLEYHGVQPVLSLPRGADAKFFGLDGNAAALPVTADCIGVEYKDRRFGIFGPTGTRFTSDGGNVNVEFKGQRQFLTICPLSSATDLATFHRYAYAVPRDTKMSWQYDPARGQVNTTWRITTELLQGAEHQILQGWIPHHYWQTTNDLKFNGINYISPRGQLRCTTGTQFTISYPFNGIVPNLPAPKPVGGAHDFDPARLHTYFSSLLEKPTFGADTYWGGKDVLRFGQCALMAQQVHDPLAAQFRDDLRAALTDWFTYEPGKKDHFFVRYPRWKGLLGINPSYGSQGFNDHHFHYGYFTFAAALLALQDRQFAADYGGMAKLIAKDYANWERTDQSFPFLRTFDIWAGHSWAGGTSSPGGENQESSSEAVQGWAGLTFLGQALGDRDMTAAGIMGYAMETQAAREYWFNASGDIFPPEWKHPVTGMVWGGGKVYGTYFTGDPAWIYGIQWLPASPMLSYLVRDPAFARKSYENMVADYEAHEQAEAAKPPKPGEKPHVAQPATIKSFGSGLGSVMLGYVLMYDPDWAAAQLDTLWHEPGDQIAHNASEMTTIYYMAHAMCNLGRVDWTYHTTSPTSMVYYNDRTKTRSYIVWNPTTAEEAVNVYQSGKLTGHITAAPQSLTCATSLSAAPIH